MTDLQDLLEEIPKFPGKIIGRIKSVLTLLSPSSIEPFFKDMKPGHVIYTPLYILIMGLFTFGGHFISYGHYLSFVNYSGMRYSYEMSIKLALVYYATAISIIFVMGFAFQLLRFIDSRFQNKNETLMGGIAIAANAMSIGIIGGIFKAIPQTAVVQMLLITYSIYILYTAIKARYGFEDSLSVFLFVLVIGSISGIIIFRLGVTILGIPTGYY